jgi:protocatechuate 3,4-dioxygenase beta subunit
MRLFSSVLLVLSLALSSGFAPRVVGAQGVKTGAIKGKVRGEEGGSVDGVTVTARQGERDVASAQTNRKGEFVITNVPAGSYALAFRKPGLRVGTMQNVVVEAGKTRSLRDRLYLPVDEGSIAFLRGSVFDSNGRSVPGARIEIARLNSDGTARRFDARLPTRQAHSPFASRPNAASIASPRATRAPRRPRKMLKSKAR